MRKIVLLAAVLTVIPSIPAFADPLTGTKPLEWEDDIASRLVEQVDGFLLKELDQSVANRAQHWRFDFSSPAAFERSVEPNRKRLRHILGLRDQRVAFDALRLLATTKHGATLGGNERFEIFAIRWPVLADPDGNRQNIVVHGEGLLLVPKDRKPIADIVAIPDADQTPEQLVGLADGIAPASQFARLLADRGCRVVIPTLVSREMKRRAPPGQGGRANLSNREFIYRSAFELGRQLIGYEIQKVLALVDWFERDNATNEGKIGVIGYGEGGAIAFYCGALDTRIDATLVSGYFGPRESLWRQPLDRNVFGLLEQFGDAEIATMVMPRHLFIDHAEFPNIQLPSEGGGPASIETPSDEQVRQEYQRIESSLSAAGEACEFLHDKLQLTIYPTQQSDASKKPNFCAELQGFYDACGVDGNLVPKPSELRRFDVPIDVAQRQQRQIDELDQFNQLLLRESPFVRKSFMSRLDTSSVEAYEKSVEAYRKIFRDEAIGSFDRDALPFNPRTRKTWETDKWTGYEVVLDVWPGVFAYGALLLPKDMKTDGSEKRPVVVCQHGLEGRPTDTFLDDHRAYHDFAGKLADRGFITFAPQNLYIFRDRFRTLQRKANPLGKTLFSIIVPQHQQTVDWLQSMPFVDPRKIAFYGLSYGGKSAMRIPALVTDYCLSICSADFNEWVLKNASTRHPFSYVWTGEYEIFEFDLGSTFNYSEMAALICPRPFMVERGHFDGVGWDEWVAYEFAKVRNLYQARLGIGDRAEIEWFVGPHTINGKGTFEFLHKHLNWPKVTP